MQPSVLRGGRRAHEPDMLRSEEGRAWLHATASQQQHRRPFSLLLPPHHRRHWHVGGMEPF
eukprot:18936-Eustigmatos_ZCMA.PRE.1